MNDETNDSNPEDNAAPSPVPEQRNWREMRREERRARRAARRQGNFGWIGGAVLIVIGIAFLLQNLGLPTLQNWWAVFILIPALGSLATAWNIYQNNGRQFTAAVRWPLLSGLIIAAIAVIFLFNISFGAYWPLLLIAGGLLILLNGFYSR